MITIISKRTRKLHNNNNNSNMTRLSRRIQKGGVNLQTVTITDEATYLEVLNKILADYNLLEPNIDKIINKGMIPDEIFDELVALSQDNRIKYSDTKLSTILTKMNSYNAQRLETYKKLLADSKPEYPYARNQTKEERKSIEAKAKADKELERDAYKAHRERNPPSGDLASPRTDWSRAH